MTTVLFSSAGRRAELINCFRQDARDLAMPLRVVAVDVQPQLSAACHLADASFPVPRCTQPDFISTLLDICRRESVRLLIPTIDTELQALADHRADFSAAGTHVAVSDPETVRMARDKSRTVSFLDQIGIPTPKSGTVDQVLDQPASWRWPIILKPVAGSSSVGIQVARDLDHLRALSAQRDDYLAQEFWEGREYTVNMFFDRSGRFRCAVPHLRKETRTGEVSKGITHRHPLLMDIAAKLGASLKGARGALCFQAIVTDRDEAAVFEINARFGGGYPLAHRAGATFSKWLLEEISGRPCSAHNDWHDRVLMLRYDAAVFAEGPPGL